MPMSPDHPQASSSTHLAPSDLYSDLGRRSPRTRVAKGAAGSSSSTRLREVVVRVRHLERLVREAAQEIAELVAEVADDV